GPTLVEAVTFRMGGHSSSDDPTRYRDANLVGEWERRDPLPRFRTYLHTRGVLTEDHEKTWTDEIHAEIGAAIEAAEALPPAPLPRSRRPPRSGPLSCVASPCGRSGASLSPRSCRWPRWCSWCPPCSRPGNGR